MAEKDIPDNLTPKQKIFCQQYIYDWNGSRAYKQAYKNVNDETARVNASQLLTKTNIQAYIESIQKDIEKQAGISQMKVLQEYMKIAFSNIADLHNTWIDRNEFDKLTEAQKAAIAEIDTRIVRRAADKVVVDIEQIKIKLHDKQKALAEISRMLGYNAPEKHDHTSKGEQIVISDEEMDIKLATALKILRDAEE